MNPIWLIFFRWVETTNQSGLGVRETWVLLEISWNERIFVGDWKKAQSEFDWLSELFATIDWLTGLKKSLLKDCKKLTALNPTEELWKTD